MRILIITQYFWPETFRINDLAKGLVDLGHEITVLTGKPNYPDGKFYDGYGFFRKSRDEYCGIEVVRAPVIPRGKGSSIRLVVNYISFAIFASFVALRKCYRSYDLIFVYEPSPITVGIPAILLKKVARVPIIFWVQDIWPESLTATGAIKSKLIIKLVRTLVKVIYKACDLILVQSEAFVSSIRSLGIEESRIRFYPNSAEDFYFSSCTVNDKVIKDILPDGFIVMFAGNIGAAQDFSTILSASERLRKHKDIKWVILGDGRKYDWLKKEVDRRSLNNIMIVLGRKPVEEMSSFFSQADVMLVTLKKDPIFSMTIPAKLQSYLASGKPIVAALDGEGARVIREAQAGLVAPSEDDEMLADRVLKMYNMDSKEREKMGAQGRVYFREQFDRDYLLRELDSWMNEIQQQGSI